VQRLGPVIHQIRSSLARRLMPSDGSVVCIPFGIAAGMKWIIHRDLTPGYHWGYHEREVQFWIHALRNPEGVMFDVGANVGFYALVGARTFRRVVCFEPDPRARSRLCELIQVNGLEEIVTVDPRAISSVDGPVYMELSGRPEASHIVSDDSYGGEKIDSITLNTAVQQYQIPSLVKLDVEGACGEILLSLSSQLPQTCFVVELHNEQEATGVGNFIEQHSLQVVCQKKPVVSFGRFSQYVVLGHLDNPQFERLLK
jgi:FkbM family methyltransferase